jgi:hypothetical protein
MSWPTETSLNLLARAQAAAEVVTGQRFTHVVAAPVNPEMTQVRVTEMPNLEITYLARYGELRVADRGLEADTASVREMSESHAVTLARLKFMQLAAANLLDPRQYDWSKASIGSTWVGGGVRGGPTLERKRIEYRITLRRSINGIEMANSGVRIAVHTSGRISSLRLGGVNVASRVTNGVEEPTGQGRWLTAQASFGDLRGRLQRSMSRSTSNSQATMRVAWERLMYVMPENQQSAVVEPMYVVSYSIAVPTEGDHVAVSRRKTMGFSLVNPTAEPVDLTPAEQPPEIDTRWKRQ